jgi:hypothetical protein
MRLFNLLPYAALPMRLFKVLPQAVRRKIIQRKIQRQFERLDALELSNLFLRPAIGSGWLRLTNRAFRMTGP